MENAEAHLREFDERSFSQGCADGLYQTGIWGYGASLLAPIPDFNKTIRAYIGIK